MESYETLSRNENRLEELAPDCISLDESHKAKNKSAGLTRRLNRFISTNPTVDIFACTGTSIRKSYVNPGHVAQWCLGRNNPYPNDARAIASYAREVDPPRESDATIEVGALAKWVGKIGRVTVGECRDALRRRVVETPGVVATSDEGPECGLILDAWESEPVPAVAKFVLDVEDFGQLPDGRDIVDHIRMHDVKMQAVMGYYIDWTVKPPEYWMHARRLWFRLVRHLMQHSQCDTVDHVVREMQAGRLKDRNAGEFMRMLRTDPADWQVPEHVNIREWWHNAKPTFTPQSKVNWISEEPLQQVAAWCADNPNGLVWSRNPCFGERLETERSIGSGEGARDGGARSAS